MKNCFGKELAARFGAGTAPIGEDPAIARKECYDCEDLERCAIVVNLTIRLTKARQGGGLR